MNARQQWLALQAVSNIPGWSLIPALSSDNRHLSALEPAVSHCQPTPQNVCMEWEEGCWILTGTTSAMTQNCNINNNNNTNASLQQIDITDQHWDLSFFLQCNIFTIYYLLGWMDNNFIPNTGYKYLAPKIQLDADFCLKEYPLVSK